MDLTIILMTIIAFFAAISVLSVIFHWLLSPVKDNQIRLEAEVKNIQIGQAEIKADISSIKQILSQSK